MKIQVLLLLALAVTVMEAYIYARPCDSLNECGYNEEPIFDLRQVTPCSCGFIDQKARSEPSNLAGLIIVKSCDSNGKCSGNLKVRRDIDGFGRVDCVCVDEKVE